MQIHELLASGNDFELWKAVAQGVFDRRWRQGLEALTAVQRIAIGTWAASGMIGNRGFVDHSQEEMASWAAAYDELDLTEAAEAIFEASTFMPTDDDDEKEGALDLIEEQFSAADMKTAGLVAQLIRKRSE